MALSDPKTLLKTRREHRQSVYHEGRELFCDQSRERISRRSFLLSGHNLAHYPGLRRHDLRQVQTALMPLSLSSLGRCEARVLPTLDAVITSLGAICQVAPPSLLNHPCSLTSLLSRPYQS